MVVESNLRAALASPGERGGHRGTARVFRKRDVGDDRRGTSVERNRAALDRRAGGVARVAAAIRVASASQSRDAGRESRDGIAHRRWSAAAAGAGCSGASGEPARTANHSAQFFLRGYRRTVLAPDELIETSKFPSRCPSSCASIRSRNGAWTTSAQWRPRWRWIGMRREESRAPGSHLAVSRRFRCEPWRPKRRSWASAGTRPRWSACRRLSIGRSSRSAIIADRPNTGWQSRKAWSKSSCGKRREAAA